MTSKKQRYKQKSITPQEYGNYKTGTTLPSEQTKFCSKLLETQTGMKKTRRERPNKEGQPQRKQERHQAPQMNPREGITTVPIGFLKKSQNVAKKKANASSVDKTVIGSPPVDPRNGYRRRMRRRTIREKQRRLNISAKEKQLRKKNHLRSRKTEATD